VNTRELTESLGVSRRALTKWKAAGCPCRKGPGAKDPIEWDRDQVVAWLERVGRSTSVGRPLGGSAADALGAPPEAAPPAPPAGSAAPAAAAVSGSGSVGAAELTRLIRLAGLRIKQLEAAKRFRLEQIASGQLIAKEAVDAGRVDRVRYVRSLILSMPARLSATLAACAGNEAEIDGCLAEWAREVCNVFAGESS